MMNRRNKMSGPTLSIDEFREALEAIEAEARAGLLRTRALYEAVSAPR